VLPYKYASFLSAKFLNSRLQEVMAAFLKVLQADDREQPLVHFRTLEGRQKELIQKYKDTEQLKNCIVKNLSDNGLLHDTVSLLSSQLQETYAFFDAELRWLNPRIMEAKAISTILNETVSTVKVSERSERALRKTLKITNSIRLFGMAPSSLGRNRPST